MTDSELVKLALENIDYFGDIIERYEDKLKIYVMRISNFSEEDAEEILQEVFIKAWKNLREFDKSLKFSSWIYRITHNQTISSFRKFKARAEDKKIPLDDMLFDLASSELAIGDQLHEKERAQVVHSVLDTLPESQKEVIILKYFEDKSYEEIADILKKPMGTVSAMLNRSKKAFKQKIKAMQQNHQIHL